MGSWASPFPLTAGELCCHGIDLAPRDAGDGCRQPARCDLLARSPALWQQRGKVGHGGGSGGHCGVGGQRCWPPPFLPGCPLYLRVTGSSTAPHVDGEAHGCDEWWQVSAWPRGAASPAVPQTQFPVSSPCWELWLLSLCVASDTAGHPLPDPSRGGGDPHGGRVIHGRRGGASPAPRQVWLWGSASLSCEPWLVLGGGVGGCWGAPGTAPACPGTATTCPPRPGPLLLRFAPPPHQTEVG